MAAGGGGPGAGERGGEGPVGPREDGPYVDTLVIRGEGVEPWPGLAQLAHAQAQRE